MSRCSLSNQPALRSGLEEVPEPIYSRSVRADLTIVVDSEGHVVDRLTRYWTVSAFAGDFHAVLRRQILGWEFEPGILDGEPRQYGFRLRVATAVRRDEVPSRIRWSYRPGGARGDTLYGTWEPTDAAEPIGSDRRASGVRSVVRELGRMNVLVRLPGESRCLIYDGPEWETVARVLYEELRGRWRIRIGSGRVGDACTEDFQPLRLMLSDFILSGGERMVVHVAGDFLPAWPPGFDAVPARAWTAECVVPRSSDRESLTLCNVTPVWSGIPALPFGQPGLLEARSDTDSTDLAFVARVTSSDAFVIDTLFGRVDRVPDLTRTAQYVPRPATCTGSIPFVVEGPAESEGAIIFWLRPDTAGNGHADIDLVEVRTPRQNVRSRGPCADPDVSHQPWFLFSVGGIGPPLRDTVSFCAHRPLCGERHQIFPGDHEPLSEPHLRFRTADLRDGVRDGAFFMIRLDVDRDAPGLMPFTVRRTDARTMAFGFRRTAPGQFDLAVNFGDDPIDVEYFIYFVSAATASR